MNPGGTGMSAEPVKLFWTGGWDTTFRLLDLVLLQGKAVQPIYVITRDRLSYPLELAAREKIERAVAARDPVASRLILPTRFFERSDIRAYPHITEAHSRLHRRLAPLWPQYEWLARLAEQMEWHDIEMGVHVDDQCEPWVDNPFFCRFSFPLISLSKRDMEAKAASAGFLNIMQMTWFCRRPDSKGRACGLCAPCEYAVDQGLGHLIPWQGHLRRLRRPIKTALNHARTRLIQARMKLGLRSRIRAMLRRLSLPGT